MEALTTAFSMQFLVSNARVLIRSSPLEDG
jgi:hypothetical protein